jgi:glycosyltransferase involved in cell wall biosynthesis
LFALKILFYCHYFPPEVNAPATRTYEHCRRWVELGHDVTVVTCAPNCPDGVVFEGYKNRIFRQIEMVDGIRVVRVWTYVAANSGTIPRIANYVSYQISAMVATLRLARPDIVIATSPQFFCGWAGVWASRMKRCHFLLEIRDIWPESIAAVGAMKKGLATRFLEWLEIRMYRSATHIVAVGTGYRDKVLEKVPDMEGKITVITNGVDAGLYIPAEPDQDFLSKHGFSGKFVCSYVGTIGMAHGLAVVVKAAKELKKIQRTDIVFLIVGDGAEREKLQQMAKDEGVADLIAFTGLLGKQDMPKVLASSDCCLVHLRGTELFGTVIPSKIFETMAMQRPIIMGVKGPAREIVQSAGGGVAMEPDNELELASRLIELADNPEKTRQMGKGAREYVMTHFNRDGLASRFESLLREIVGQEIG